MRGSPAVEETARLATRAWRSCEPNFGIITKIAIKRATLFQKYIMRGKLFNFH